MKKVRNHQRAKTKNPQNLPRQPNHQHHQKQHPNHRRNLQRLIKIRTNPNSSEYIQRSLGTHPVDSHAVRHRTWHDSEICEKNTQMLIGSFYKEKHNVSCTYKRNASGRH